MKENMLNVIEMEDTFSFHCTMCGKCCTQREDILLNGRDVYNISRYLNISPKKMIKRYCEGYIGSESGLPIVRLKPIGPLHVCPFLKKRKCEINVVKPFVCAFFPLGRVYRYNENTPLEKHSLEPKYIYTNPQCGDDADTYTVLEWMEKNNIPVKDDFGDMWSWVVFRCAGLMRDAESSLPDVLVYQIRSFLCSMMYFNYSINEDFMTQFYSNFEKIKKFVKEYFSI